MTTNMEIKLGWITIVSAGLLIVYVVARMVMESQ